MAYRRTDLAVGRVIPQQTARPEWQRSHERREVEGINKFIIEKSEDEFENRIDRDSYAILDVSALSIFSSCQNLGVYKTTHHVATYRRRKMTNIIKFATETKNYENDYISS